MMISVIDYGCGNLHSVKNALITLGCEVQVTSDPNIVNASERIILPGVGAFKTGMENLSDSGLLDCLNDQFYKERKPILGICLGQQLMATSGAEGGFTRGLGWIDAKVEQLNLGGNDYPLPHVGWNEVYCSDENSLLKELGKSPVFYFTHSFALQLEAKNNMSIGWCDYGTLFPAFVQIQNLVATQFHPEKSQDIGMRFLSNFLEWEPFNC